MSTSITRHLACLAALAALAAPSQAWLHSQSTQGGSSRHEVRILDHVIRTSIHQGWADVEEELSLGTQASTDTWNPAPTDNLGSWEIAGSFNLPEGSVVTGALLWDGNVLLKAKLKGATAASNEYEAIVDRQTAPRALPRDPLLIEKIGDNYSMKLFPVQWGATRRMRIRYMVPLQSLGDGWTIPVGSAFAGEVAAHPDQYQIDLDNRGGDGIKIGHEGMLMPLGNTTKLVDYPASQGASTSWWEPAPAYHAPYAAVLPQRGSIALATSMDSGSWKGSYVVYRGKLPDTLLSKSHLRQELVVMWKWNSPSSFVTDYGWGKQLTGFGYEALQEASLIASSTATLARASNLVRIGLVADEGDNRKVRRFGLSGWGSDTFALMQEYLGSFTQDTILNRYDGTTGSVGSTNGAADRKAGAKRFASDLQIAFSLYSKDSGVVRHIVFVSAGPAEDFPDPTIALPAWPQGLTASAFHYGSWDYGFYGDTQAHWPGVDLPALVEQHALPAEKQLSGWLPFVVPLTRVTWELGFTAGSRHFALDAVTGLQNGAGSTTMLEFNGHAKTAWSQNLSWKLYDENGNLVTSTTANAANWIELPHDSSIARLWGGSTRHWSETWRTRGVGNIFGFVDPSHSLLATPADSLSSDLQGLYREAGVPFLLPSEIFGTDVTGVDVPPEDPNVPPTSGLLSKTDITGFLVRSQAGGRGLTIALPAGLDANSELVVRDLHGRILAKWSASQLTSLKSIEWSAPAGAARGMLYVELRTGSLRTVRTASIL
ncbi:MAG: hypothetical protein RL173_966 [Fibrobacterota bacterium]|jgi:hypothetical protein